MKRTDLHEYQNYCVDFLKTHAEAMLILEMGLGKSAISLTAIADLMFDSFDVGKTLVIAPLRVAKTVWPEERETWEQASFLQMSVMVGSAKQREAALAASADVYVVNRENVKWLVDYLEKRRIPWPFDMVVVDESSSFKSPSAKRFKALKRMLPRIHRVVILTGTPAPNGIEDLWSQIYLLDRGERLGRYVTHYRERYFDHNPWRHEYVPKPGAFEAVQNRISDICVSMKAEDWIQLPEMIVQDVPVVLEGAGLKAYREMERTMVAEVGGEEISAMTAAGLANKLLQLCGGSVYDEAGQAHHVHDAKLEALGELIEQLHGEHALLLYEYQHELPGIEAALKGLRWRRLESAEDAEAWNRGEVDVLIAHPASCAYGLNLQDGGHHVIWFTLTWSLELYQQANARLHRQGQEKPVIVHRLLVQGGVDEDVAKALEGKDETQAALVEALKARIERVMR